MYPLVDQKQIQIFSNTALPILITILSTIEGQGLSNILQVQTF
jgi:hypothetical protein